jgi:hypothetical protein
MSRGTHDYERVRRALHIKIPDARDEAKMSGHSRRRGKQSWELKFDAGRDAAGKRIVRYHSFRGTKREAVVKLAEL